MKGDIALAGFVLTAEEWDALDALSRTQILAAALERDAPWVAAHLAELISGPTETEPRSD